MSFALAKVPFQNHPKALVGRRNGNGNGAHTPAAAPARDRVIDFGKHKGKILGTLPSTYLKWVSKNLRAREFEEWAIIADQVLEDPVYQDRIQWEFAHNVLSGKGNSTRGAGDDVVSQLLEISERFGWDWDATHKAGWRNLNFELLGTSKGGRIPRIDSNITETSESKMKTQNTLQLQGGRRRERRDRLRLKRETSKSKGAVDNKTETKPTQSESPNTRTTNPNIREPFPGRQTLLNRATKPRYATPHSQPSSS